MVKKRHFIIVISILLAGLIVGSFLDLEINKAIFSENNTFSLIMASFATYPGYGGLAFIGGGFFGSTFKRKDMHIALKIVSYFLSVLAYGMSIWLCGKDMPSVNGFNNPALAVPSYLICAIIFAGIFYFAFSITKTGDRQRFWVAMMVMAVIFVVGLLPVGFIVKRIMHRPRYRYFVKTNPDLFHNWWERFANYKDYLYDAEGNAVKIGNITMTSEEFKSFPSGHSGTAAITMMLLPYLSLLFNKLKGKETLLFYIGFGWTLVMMFSRMLCGAHYLTDTCMGALIVIVVYFAVHVFTIEKGWMFAEPVNEKNKQRK